MKQNDIIIAFAPKTTKLLPRLLCRKYRHCCVIFPVAAQRRTLVQIGADGVRLFPVNARALRRMEQAGWVMARVEKPKGRAPGLHAPGLPSFLTCVGFAKKAAGIRNPMVWTPGQLYRIIAKREQSGRAA
jgi:hypothetical protein